jgi:hypothetical protein
MVRLEADERQVVTEARSAASTAAANAVGSFISEATTVRSFPNEPPGNI